MTKAGFFIDGPREPCKVSSRIYRIWRDMNSIADRAKLLTDEQRGEVIEGLREIADTLEGPTDTR